MNEALENIVAAVVDGEPVSLAAILRHAKTNNGMTFLDRAVDGYLIERAADREGITVDDREIDAVIERVRSGKQGEDEHTWTGGAGLPREAFRAAVRRTIRFGKLKGKVADPMLSRLGEGLVGALDLPARRAMRDMLFLHWLGEERARSQIELRLLESV
jgi:hypothetical protein